jgi:hypothetical protein
MSMNIFMEAFLLVMALRFATCSTAAVERWLPGPDHQNARSIGPIPGLHGRAVGVGKRRGLRVLGGVEPRKHVDKPVPGTLRQD